MNNLPKDIENLIDDYKISIEVSEKYERCLDQIRDFSFGTTKDNKSINIVYVGYREWVKTTIIEYDYFYNSYKFEIYKKTPTWQPGTPPATYTEILLSEDAIDKFWYEKYERDASYLEVVNRFYIDDRAF